MSGLLPRVSPTQQTGNFNTINTKNLDVSGAAFINSLTTNALSISDLTVNSVTTPVINGDPDLNLVAPNVTVNGSAIVTADSTTTFTNKTISATDNTITVNLPFDGDTNINDIINQKLTTTSSVDFLDVSTVGGVFAGGAGQFSQVLTAAVNDLSAGNTCLVNGVNPLTTDTYLHANVDQDVRTTATPTWNTINCNQIAGSPVIISGTNFNAFVSSVNTNLGQNVSPTASPTWVGATFTGVTNDNTATNILALNGSNALVYKNNVSDISTAQTFTNKSIKVPSCKLVDNSDTTKVINFLTSGSTTGTNTQLTFAQTANRVITFPDSTATLIGDVTTQTLTNKTLTAPTIATITNGGTITIPSGTDTLVGRATTDTLTNKTISAGILSACNYTSNSVTNFPITFNTAALTAARAITWIDGAGTVILDTATQTMSNKTLNSTCVLSGGGLSACNYSSNIVSHFPITFDTSGLTAPRSITWSNNAGVVVLDTASQTLTNKTLTAPTIATITNGGTLTLPSGTDTIVARNTTETLTNKTLTSVPSISLVTTANSFVTFNSLCDLGYSNAAGAWFTSSAAGDVNLRNTNTARSVNLGVGSATAQLQLNNTVTKNVVTSIDDYTNNTTKAKSTFPISTSSAAGATTTLLTIPVTTNTSIAIFMYLSTRKLTGTITGYGSYIYDWKALNNAGTVTATNGNNQAKSEQAVAGAFAGIITPSIAVVGTTVNINLANTFADGTLIEAGYIEVLFS